ncbi:hypothetical protein OIV83_004855 [Microbotryomycetes sp. JL201]|nr:hypothetical protein OIV83_004855 [Microbotryomycetes sp. JL201]
MALTHAGDVQVSPAPSDDESELGSGPVDAPKRPKTAGGRSAPRASKACRECRRRKARCDNKQPACGGCLRNKVACEYLDDGRKLAKNQFANLRARLAELERKVQSTNEDSGESYPSRDQSTLPLPPLPVLAVEHHAEQQSIFPVSKGITPPAAVSTTSASGISPPAPSLPALSPPAAQADLASPAAKQPVPDRIRRDLDSVDGLRTPFVTSDQQPLAGQITRIKGRMSVSDGGVLRWYGATSNRHLSFGVLSNFRAPQKPLETRCLETLAKLGEPVCVDERLEHRLLSLYEVWHNQFFHISDNAIFRAHRQRYLAGQGDHQFFSFTLWYAMLAYASPLSNETRAYMLPEDEDPGDIWARKARACLDEEMQCPRETTVQALAILAAREVCCGRDARGWMYIGMACSCAVDLGLHQDTSELVEVGGMTTEQYRMRCIIWWGVFEYASLWGLYVGRPSIISVQQITCAHPSASGGETFTASLVSLIQIANSITKELYSGSHLIGAPDSDSSTVLEMHQNLLDWHNSLPATETLDLELHPSPAPHVILLHLQYYALMILLHRPFVSMSPVISPSFEICCNAAASTAYLLELYRRLYTFSKIAVVAVHQVFTAATTLVYIVYACEEAKKAGRPVPDVATSARSHLLVCLAALSAMATRQAHAQRSYISIIILMKRSHVTLDDPAKANPMQGSTLASQRTKSTSDRPPNEQFESLARSLFEMSDVADRPLNWDEVLAMPAVSSKSGDLDLLGSFTATAPQPDLAYTNQPIDNSAIRTVANGTAFDASSSAIPASNMGTNGTQSITDFFDILSNAQGMTAMHEWTGPSLTDMFDTLPL